MTCSFSLNDFHILDVNQAASSDTMASGVPKYLNTCVNKRSVLKAEGSASRGIDFKNLSMMTSVMIFCRDGGRSVIKSRAKFDQGHCGLGDRYKIR